MNRLLATQERIDWMQLAHTPGVGALTFHRLLQAHGSAGLALDSLLSRGRITPPPAAAIEAELEQLARLGARVIASCEPDYTSLLGQFDPAPPLLSVRGDATLFRRPLVAIVGAARRARGGGHGAGAGRPCRDASRRLRGGGWRSLLRRLSARFSQRHGRANEVKRGFRTPGSGAQRGELQPHVPQIGRHLAAGGRRFWPGFSKYNQNAYLL